jgi:hypothetical protein
MTMELLSPVHSLGLDLDTVCSGHKFVLQCKGVVHACLENETPTGLTLPFTVGWGHSSGATNAYCSQMAHLTDSSDLPGLSVCQTQVSSTYLTTSDTTCWRPLC